MRLTKYWNKTQLNDAFSSYYIELAISKRFLDLKAQGTRYGYILDALATAMGALESAYLNGNIESLIAEAPPVTAPALSAQQTAWLNSDTTNASVALRQAYTEGNEDGALATLNAIFGTGFFS